jgi:F0F1-type ATP synthase assembly protein I
MGCLPLPLLFLLGTGIGYLIARQDGALWGAGIGLLLGLAATVAAIRALRGKR